MFLLLKYKMFIESKLVGSAIFIDLERKMLKVVSSSDKELHLKAF